MSLASVVGRVRAQSPDHGRDRQKTTGKTDFLALMTEKHGKRLLFFGGFGVKIGNLARMSARIRLMDQQVGRGK